jgi:AcrR family transcriptional regulator
MTTRRIEAPEVRRTQIISAARDLLVEKGYSELLLDDVARRAGVAKGTLYLYFHDKPALFRAVMEHLLDDLSARLVRATEPASDDPLVPVRATISEMLSYMDMYKDIFFACGQARRDWSRKVGDPLKRRFVAYVDLLGGILQAAVRKRALRPHDERTGGMMLIALTRMFVMRKTFLDRTVPVEAATEEMMDLLLNGLGAGKGKRS